MSKDDSREREEQQSAREIEAQQEKRADYSHATGSEQASPQPEDDGNNGTDITNSTGPRCSGDR